MKQFRANDTKPGATVNQSARTQQLNCPWPSDSYSQCLKLSAMPCLHEWWTENPEEEHAELTSGLSRSPDTSEMGKEWQFSVKSHGELQAIRTLKV